jgi:hypothetical protein
MTFEEMERAMQFILAQQAKFDADIARVTEAIDRSQAVVAQHTEGIAGLLQISRTLINSQIAAEGRMAIIEEKMAELAAAEKRTDERLDSFIDFFERYMSRGSEPERTQ